MIDTSQLTGTQEPEPYRWIYFAPPQFRELSAEHQDQFYFLDAASTENVYEVVNSVDLLCGDDGWGNTPFSGGCYDSVEHFERSGNEGGLKKWLYRRSLPFKTDVLLLPVFKTESSPVIMTSWKMVSKYTETFFTGDNLIIVDPSLSWCLYYHHDDILHFARDRKY